VSSRKKPACRARVCKGVRRKICSSSRRAVRAVSRRRFTAARLIEDQSYIARLLTFGLAGKSGWPVRTSSGAELTRNTAWLRSAGLLVAVACVGPQKAICPFPSTKTVELVRPEPAVLASPGGRAEMP